MTTKATLAHLDVSLLMWNIRRNINPEPMPQRRDTVQFIYTDLPPAKRNWWLIVEPGKEPDLCSVDPGFDVDLYVTTDLRTMTELWTGYTSTVRAKKEERLFLTGNRQLQADFQLWLVRAGLPKWKNASPEQVGHMNELTC